MRNAPADTRAASAGGVDEAALDRFRLLRPIIDNEVALTAVARSSGVPEPTLRRWLARYRRHGLIGLQRSRRRDRGQPRCLSPELVAIVEGLALQRPRRSTATIHRLMCAAVAQQGRPAPSYATVHAAVRAMDPAMAVLAHEGAKAYGQRYELLHRREAAAPNEIWQADHTELDILVHDATGAVIRPWLTIVIDDHSRAIAAYHLATSAPSALQTALALRRAIWRKGEPGWTVCGIPQRLYTDHGCDFTSRHIEQVCAALKMRLIFSQIGQPRGRGRIERFFGTLNTCCLAELPGYLASGAPAPKPGLTLAELDAALRRCGASSSSATTTRRMARPGSLPRHAGAQAGFCRRCQPHSRHSTCCCSPWCGRARLGATASASKHCATSRPRWLPSWGEAVTIRYDPADMAEIRVFQSDRFLCHAICQELAGETVSFKEITTARVKRRRVLGATIRARRSLVEQILAPPQTVPEPVTAKPAASKPAASKPAASKPAAPASTGNSSTGNSTGASRLRRYEHE